jgi:hypothetical protein
MPKVKTGTADKFQHLTGMADKVHILLHLPTADRYGTQIPLRLLHLLIVQTGMADKFHIGCFTGMADIVHRLNHLLTVQTGIKFHIGCPLANS